MRKKDDENDDAADYENVSLSLLIAFILNPKSKKQNKKLRKKTKQNKKQKTEQNNMFVVAFLTFSFFRR